MFDGELIPRLQASASEVDVAAVLTGAFGHQRHPERRRRRLESILPGLVGVSRRLRSSPLAAVGAGAGFSGDRRAASQLSRRSMPRPAGLSTVRSIAQPRLAPSSRANSTRSRIGPCNDAATTGGRNSSGRLVLHHRRVAVHLEHRPGPAELSTLIVGCDRRNGGVLAEVVDDVDAANPGEAAMWQLERHQNQSSL